MKRVAFILVVVFSACHQSAREDKLLEDVLNNRVENLEVIESDSLVFLYLDYKVLDSIAKVSEKIRQDHSLLRLRRLTYLLHFDQANHLVDSLLQTNLSDNVLASLIKQKLYILDENFSSLKEKHNYLNLYPEFSDYNSYSSLLLKLEQLLLHSNIVNSQNKINSALSKIEYGLYLIRKEDINGRFEKLKADFLGRKAAIKIREDSNKSEEIIRLLDKATGAAKSLGFFEKEVHYEINKANSISIFDLDQSIHIMGELKSRVKYFSPELTYYYWINLGFLRFKNQQVDQAVTCLANARALLLRDPCNKKLLFANKYLSEALMLRDKLDSDLEYLRKLISKANCDENYELWHNFYMPSVKIAIIQLQKDIQSNIDTTLLLHFRSRNAAKKIFKDKDEFHLGDYYTESCASILDLLLEHFGNSIPKKYQELVINLLEDTKSKEVKLQQYTNERVSSDQDILDSLNIEIDTRLREIDDFYATDKYNDIVYEELYQLYLQKDDLLDKVEYAADPEPLSLIDLQAELAKRHLVVSNFLAYGTSQYRIDIDDKGMDIYKTDFLELEKKSRNCLDGILNAKGHDTLCNEIWNSSLDSTKTNAIIADEWSSKLPPDINHEQNYFYIKGYEQLLLNAADTLSTDEMSIFSYSDSISIRNDKPKDYLDLASGFEESQLIHQFFPGSKFQSYSSFNPSTFSTACTTSDLLHVSSHAYSNSEKRQDCFLLMRDEAGNPYKWYSTSVAGLSSTPKFVNLSCCNTGTGVHKKGKGVYSLSRAFLDNSTETVLKTLWPVDDKATKVFMVRFYQEWLSGLPIVTALSNTKVHMKTSELYSHPYFWAGFAIEGNPDLYLRID